MPIKSGCYLRVGLLGINYKTADLALREEVARISQKISGERALFFKHPTVILSTCNRTEIYFSATDLAEAHSDLLAFLRSSLNEPFEQRLYAYFGMDCFSHLARVTAGLDSAILAETEIQRQVKLAYQHSSEIVQLPSCIHYLFQKSLKVAKAARNSFSIERGASTLYGTLWMIASRHFVDLQKIRILLVGYSEINRGFASFLLHRNMRGLCIATRRPLEVKIEGASARGRECLQSWNEFDWIICAAKSEEFLIRGTGRNQLIFDLGVPRNVDPNIKNVMLWNIEQINSLIEQNRCLAEKGVAQAEAQIQESVSRLCKLYCAKCERTKLLQAL